MSKIIRISQPNVPKAGANALVAALLAGSIDPGWNVCRLKERLSAFWDVPEAWILLTNSCTTAMGVGQYFFARGIYSPALTWPGTYCQSGAYRELLDSYSDGWVNPTNLTHTQKKCLAVVNLYGLHDPCLERYSDCEILLDSAHCVGIHVGRLIDSGKIWGAAFSFGPTKEINAMRGGALVTPDAMRAEEFVRYGTRSRLPLSMRGVNGTMTEQGAALALACLAEWSRDTHTRAEILDEYQRCLASSPINLITTPDRYSGHLAVLQFPAKEARDAAQQVFHDAGIQTSIHYRIPADQKGRCPVATNFSDRVLSIPCHLSLTRAHLSRIKGVLRSLP